MNKGEFEFKPFQQILVKDKDDLWGAAYFSHYRKDDCRIVTTGGEVYHEDYCLPYEGNEELLGTDKTPKPTKWRALIGCDYWFLDKDLKAKKRTEYKNEFDDLYFSIGNYFKDYEKAIEASVKIRKILDGSED